MTADREEAVRWIMDAKKEETKRKRLNQIIEAIKKNKKSVM